MALTIEWLQLLVLEAAMAGSAVWVYCVHILPALRWHRASPVAVAVAGLLAASLPVTSLLIMVMPVPHLVRLGLWAGLVLVLRWPEALVRISGGSRPLPQDVQAVFSTTGQAAELLRGGDADGAARLIRDLDRQRTRRIAAYIDLWQRYDEEELARRRGWHESSERTRAAMAAEGRRLVAGRVMGRRTTGLAVGLAVLVGATPGIARAATCIEVELLFPRAAVTSVAGELSPLAAALPTDPEPGATLVYDRALDLAAAVDAKVDPETHGQLVEAGFVGGHERGWMAADGRPIGADVFEFRDAGGALAYQRAVSRYACRFSTDAFRGPLDGIGLRTNWSRGDPISEQVSWVSGSRRFVVSIRYIEEPDDHARILEIAAGMSRE